MPPSDPLPPGTCLGPYEIVSLLGAGGMGEVYRAVDSRLGREIAIKVLPEALAADPDRLRRFRDEAQTASRLNHPNIVQVFDIGEQGGVHFVAMELIEGRTFESLCDGAGRPWQTLRSLACQVLDGLATAHEAGIVHRDLKPANLMVNDSGLVKILDFGLAKQFELNEELTRQGTRVGSPTTPGTTLGTLGYMSPEQAKGAPADHRSDQFSLGVVLYEMATGERPFERDTPAESFAAMLTADPEPLADKDTDLPAAVCDLVMRCLSKEKDQRYTETRELLEAISDGDGLKPLRLVSERDPVPAHRTPLAGRENELAQLVSHLESATKGQGGLVTLVGEPGVGKTRLTHEILRLAVDKGCLSLVGHCYEGEGAPPYSPWIEILERTGQISERDTLRELLGEGGAEVAKIYPELRQLLPDLPPPLELPPEQSRPYLFRCFREFVERSACRQPLLLILEDLHWADDATLLLLEHVVGPLQHSPVLMVGTYRDVDLDVSRRLAKTLQRLVRERRVEKIHLSRLDGEGVARMLNGLSERSSGGRETPPALVTKIHDETEGNPFFVEEVYLHLEEEGRLFDEAGQWRTDLSLDELDVPEGVRLVVGRRLERLSREEQSVLRAAAVIGRRFSYELLEVVAQGDSDIVLDAVERAEQLKLIEPGAQTRARRGSGYRFSHELIRQTLLTGLSLPRLQRLHLRVANGIEETDADPARHASALAHHLFQAGAAANDDKTQRFLSLAGEQALAAGAFEEALRHFEDALSLLEEASPEERAEVLHLRGLASYGLGRWPEARRDWDEVIPVLERQARWAALTEIALQILYVHIWQATPAEGSVFGQKILHVVPESSVRERARLLSAVGCLVEYGRDFETGQRYTSEALALAEDIGDQKVLGEVLKWRGLFCTFAMLRAEGFEVHRRAIELLRLADDDWNRIDVECFHFFCSTHLGRLDEVDEARIRASDALAERLGNYPAQHLIRAARAHRDWMRSGNIERYREQRADISDIVRKTNNAFLVGNERLLTMKTFWSGDWEAARERAPVGGQTLEGSLWEGGFEGYTFFYECYLGNEQAALAAFSEIESFLPDPSSRHLSIGPLNLLLMVVEGWSMIGRKEQAAAFYPLLERTLETGTKVSNDAERLVERVAAIAAAAGRRWEQAERHFEHALRQAHEFPFKSEQPEVRRFYAGMLMERDGPGDLEKAKELLEEAIDGYLEIGMRRHVGLARGLLDRLP